MSDMAAKIVVIDTSILCSWLNVPGKETCGPDNDRWDCKRVTDTIESLKAEGAKFVMPLAVIIEAGNHIAQCSGHQKHSVVRRFVNLIHATLDSEEPWIAFTEQTILWSAESLSALIDRWQDFALSNHSLGDASIVDVANHYARFGREVEIFTADAGLKAHQPQPTGRILPPPRRNS